MTPRKTAYWRFIRRVVAGMRAWPSWKRAGLSHEIRRLLASKEKSDG